MQGLDIRALTDALKAVVTPRNDRLPADPYKTLIQSILSSEFSEQLLLPDRKPPPVEPFPDRSDTLITQLVSFGSCGGFGLKHLAKVISDVSVRRSHDILIALRQALGDLKSEVKTKGIEALFVDVVGISTCYSEVICQPLTHTYEVTLEAIVTNLHVEPKEGEVVRSNAQGATFDECIMSFVRRIMEEAFQADQSEDILTAEITAVMGSNDKNVQRIDVRNMRDRRQQVLSILKAATVGEGEISMEIFLRINHLLQNFNRDSRGHTHHNCNITDETTGYVRILRRYRFSYCDDNTNLKRCFSRYPFESLARGVFFDGLHAKTYRDVYAKHLRKISQRQLERATQQDDANSRDKNGVLKPMDDKLYTSVFFMLIKKIKSSLDMGEYVNAADWLIQLHSLMSPNKMNMTFIIARVSQLCSSDSGKLRRVRDALSALSSVSEIMRRRIADYLNKLSTEEDDEGGVTSPRLTRFGAAKAAVNKQVEVDKELEAIKTHYNGISEATIELKLMILSLSRDVHCSEFRYVNSGLTLELWSLFKEDKIKPLVSPLVEKINDENDEINFIWKKKTQVLEEQLLHMAGTLQGVAFTYGRLENRLHMLESALGMSILLNLLQKDITTAEAAGELEFEKFEKEMEAAKASYWVEGNFDGEAWKRRDVRFCEHDWNESPRTVWEILGYIHSFYKEKMALYSSGKLAQARSVDLKINWYLDLDMSYGKVGLFQWNKTVEGKDIDAIMKFVLFDPWSSNDNKKINAGPAERRKDKLHGTARNADGTKRVLGMIDAETILRCGTGELVLTDMMHDEENRDETPKFLSSEAARIRYLTETHALRAIHESLFIAFTSVDVGGDLLLPFYSAVCQSLFKFSSYLHMWNEVPLKKIAQFVFSPARTPNGIQYSEDCCGSSVVYSNYRPLVQSVLKFISGGVFGPNRVLSGLGYAVQDIFVQAWALPPLFHVLPQSPQGMKLQTYCGFSVNSALQMGIPNYLTAINESKEEAFDLASRKDDAKRQGVGPNLTSEELEDLEYQQVFKVVGLQYPVTPLEIEVVLKYHCELSSADQYARRSFGTELSNTIHFMSSGNDWRVRNVEIFQNIQDSRRHRLSFYDNKYIFDNDQIIEDKEYDLTMQNAASKYGFACIDCSVSVPEYIAGLSEPEDAKLQDANDDTDGKVLSLSLLTQALEKASKHMAAYQSTEDYDPCNNDSERCTDRDGSACSAIQDYIKKKGYPRSFVPCRIKFTLLTHTPVGKQKKKNVKGDREGEADDGASLNTRDKEKREFLQARFAQQRQDNSKDDDEEKESFGNLSIGNAHLPRLVASTVWLSPQSATGIWTAVQKPGDLEKCYKLASEEHQEAHTALRNEGMYIDALEESKTISLLTLQYDHFTTFTRYNTSLAVNFRKQVETIRMCRHLLEAGEATTMDVGVFRHTMVKYVCLGLRLSIMSPQCVHMRGGCQLIISEILELEGLLKLAPMPTKITQPLVVVAGTKNNMGTGKYRNDGSIVTSAEKGWNENELRNALGQPSTVKEAAVLLRNIEGKCLVLLDALSKDLDMLLKEEVFNVKNTSQSFQLLDSRDIVHNNKGKIRSLMDRTVDAREVNYSASIFDENGDLKPGQTMTSMMRGTSVSTLSSVTSQGSLTGGLGETSDKFGDSEDAELKISTEAAEREAANREKVTTLMMKNKSMECMYGDMNSAEQRNVWVDREKEFSCTETGKLMAAKAADAEAAAAAAYARNKKVADKNENKAQRVLGNAMPAPGARRLSGAGAAAASAVAASPASTAAGAPTNALAALALASKMNSVQKLRNDVKKTTT